MKSGKAFASIVLLFLFAVPALAEDTTPELAPPAPIEPPADALTPPSAETPPPESIEAPAAPAPAPEKAEQKAPEPAETPKPVVTDVPVTEKTTSEIRMERGSDFQLIRPLWGTEINFSTGGLGRTTVGSGGTVKAASISFQIQPTGFQKYGVFSLGPTAAIYPFLPQNNDVVSSFYSIWSVGLAARYQARFAREQLLVPVVGVNFERFSYNIKPNAKGSFPLSGPMVGLNLLLNPLEPNAAFDFYTSTGVLRSYLTVEAMMLKGSDDNIDVSGASWFFGIRVEF